MEFDNAREIGDRLVRECGTFTLGVLDGEGRPRLYAMQKAEGTSVKEILFITKAASEKVRLLRINGMAGAEYHREEQSISLKGRIRIIEDGKKIRRLLRDDLCRRLEARGFERYCVLQFVTEEYTVYHEGEQVTLPIS